MFGALNRFISRLDAEPLTSRQTPKTASGFQVLRNNNPDLPIEPWFDFIIGINGRNIDNPDPSLFATEVRNLAGSSVNLGIWSAKGQRIRSLYVPIPADNPALGISLQWGQLSSTEDVWHILDVTPNSPADMAGLLPYGDYVIGSPEGQVRGDSGLGELVEAYLTHPLRLYVYNHEYNVTRLVTLTPNRTWGGTGALGCILGFGALHRIPASLDEPPSAPGETLFDSSNTTPAGRTSHDDASARPATSYRTSTPTQQLPSHMLAAQHPPATPPPPSRTPLFLVPPHDMPAATPTAAPSVQVFSPARDTPPRPGPPPMHAGPRRPKPPRAAASSNLLDMDAYFAEGEAQSRALEGGSGGSGGSGISSGSSRPGAAAAPALPPPAAATTEHKEKAPLAPPPKAGSLPKFASVEWLGDSVTGVMSVNPSPGMVPMQKPERRRRRTRRVGDEGTGTGEEDEDEEEEDTEEEHELLPEPRVVTPVVESARLPWEDEEEGDEGNGKEGLNQAQGGGGGGEKAEEKSQENAKENA